MNYSLELIILLVITLLFQYNSAVNIKKSAAFFFPLNFGDYFYNLEVVLWFFISSSLLHGFFFGYALYKNLNQKIIHRIRTSFVCTMVSFFLILNGSRIYKLQTKLDVNVTELIIFFVLLGIGTITLCLRIIRLNLILPKNEIKLKFYVYIIILFLDNLLYPAIKSTVIQIITITSLIIYLGYYPQSFLLMFLALFLPLLILLYNFFKLDEWYEQKHLLYTAQEYLTFNKKLNSKGLLLFPIDVDPNTQEPKAGSGSGSNSSFKPRLESPLRRVFSGQNTFYWARAGFTALGVFTTFCMTQYALDLAAERQAKAIVHETEQKRLLENERFEHERRLIEEKSTAAHRLQEQKAKDDMLLFEKQKEASEKKSGWFK